MVKKVTVRQTGTSISATIPKEVAERLHIAPGDTLYAIETERGVLLTPYDPALGDELEAYRVVARQYRNALRELAR